MEGNQRSTGTVKWFSGQKGFGFVAPDGGGEDLFVHQTEIRSEGFRTLREGQRVEYFVDYGDEDGRSKAVDVVALLADGTFRSGSGRGRGGRFGRRGGYGGYGGGDGYGGGGRGGGYGGGGLECYNCGEIGHLARECYRGGGSGGEWNYGGGGRGGGGLGGRAYVEGGGGSGRGYGGRGGGGRRGACYNCGEEGHFARDCPNEQN